MFLLTITAYGWAFIASIALSLLLTKGVLKRLFPTKNAGCFSFGYVALIISILMTMVLTLSMVISESVYSIITKPNYMATIISYTSEWKESTEKDSDGISRTKRTLMHQSTVSFRNEKNKIITLPTNVSSGEIPVIGEKIKIVYEDGDQIAEENSFRSIALLSGGILMLLLMSFILFAAMQFSLGKDMTRIKNVGAGILLRFLIPLGMAFLLTGMAYALYLFFIGKKDDMPGWAVGICIFFCAVLIIALPAYLKMAFSKNPENLEGFPSIDIDLEEESKEILNSRNTKF